MLRVVQGHSSVKAQGSPAAHPGSSSWARAGGDSLEKMQVGALLHGHTHLMHTEHKIVICFKGVLL